MNDLSKVSARKSSYQYNELLLCAQGDLFGSDYPRLPLPPMLMFDKITSISCSSGRHGKGQAIAELALTKDHWFFSCHFENDPVMPGCLGLDALWQLTGFYLGWSGLKGKGRALGVGEVRFTKQIVPSVKTVTYGIDIKNIRKGKLVLGLADGWVQADGELIYEAQKLKVALLT